MSEFAKKFLSLWRRMRELLPREYKTFQDEIFLGLAKDPCLPWFGLTFPMEEELLYIRL